MASLPEPAQPLFSGDIHAAEGAYRLPEHRHRRWVALSYHQRQAVQQQIGRACGPRRRGRGTCGRGYFPHTAAKGQAAREQRGGQRLQVGLARQPHVERLELPGRLQQQRGRVAAAAGRERDLPAQQIGPGALKLVQRPGLGRGQQRQRRIERAGLILGLSSGQRPLRPPRRLERQRDGALKERGRRGQATACLRPAARNPRPVPPLPPRGAARAGPAGCRRTRR